MIGVGTVLNPILKVLTTVAILGAVYLFIVRPVLDTTENVVSQAQEQVQQAQQGGQLSSARSRTDSYASSLRSTWPRAAREVQSCRRAAGDELRALERCAERAKDLVHVVRPDMSFALSYADSLAGQERAGDAERVRECVRKAGFKAGAMHRCRELADRLLFG